MISLTALPRRLFEYFSTVAAGAGSRLHGRGVAEKHSDAGGRLEGTEGVHFQRTSLARAGA